MRRQAFRRNEALEELLGELNDLLAGAEARVLERFRMPRWPVVLVVGAPRSGTTLAMQWLAGTGLVAYPTNFLSRFYRAPYIGARIQRLLTDPDYSFRDEFGDLPTEISYSSELGKTRGLLAPNEFWYFWRRFFRFGEVDRLPAEELERVDVGTLTAELAAVEAAFEKPFALKAMLLNWHLDFLDRVLDEVLFVHVHRDPVSNICSLLRARERFYGDRGRWYSFKPPEYPELMAKAPCEQVAGQVFHTERAVRRSLARVAPGRRLELPYEAFCRDPARCYDELADRLRARGVAVDAPYTGPARFTPTHHGADDPRLLDEIRRCWEGFAGSGEWA